MVKTCARPWLFLFALTSTALTSTAFASDPIQWRTDYATARKEAVEKNLPLFVEVQTDQCIYCRKMEASTFRDPAIAEMANNQFIPLRIDGNKDRDLAIALRVQLYPTLVLASPDGKIHGFFSGYQTADQIREPMKRTATGLAQIELIARNIEQAQKEFTAKEYAKAVSLIQPILADTKSATTASTASEQAKKMMSEIELLAAKRLVEIKNLPAQDELALRDLAKKFQGTKSADQAQNMLVTIEKSNNFLNVVARNLLAQAREHAERKEWHDSLQICEKIRTEFGQTAEAKLASQLAEELTADPNKIITEIEKQNEKTASMYLALAESWTKKGNLREANICYEQVLKIMPGTKYATLAQGRLTNPGAPAVVVPSVTGPPTATTTGLRKK
jgi:thioredoxin-related protein